MGQQINLDTMIVQKRRRDSRHWWRRIQSRKYRPTIINKTIYVTFLTVAFVAICLLYTKPVDTLALLWAILFIAIIIPDKSEEKKDESFSDCLREVEKIRKRSETPGTPEWIYMEKLKREKRSKEKEKVRLMV